MVIDDDTGQRPQRRIRQRWWQRRSQESVQVSAAIHQAVRALVERDRNYLRRPKNILMSLKRYPATKHATLAEVEHVLQTLSGEQRRPRRR